GRSRREWRRSLAQPRPTARVKGLRRTRLSSEPPFAPSIPGTNGYVKQRQFRFVQTPVRPKMGRCHEELSGLAATSSRRAQEPVAGRAATKSTTRSLRMLRFVEVHVAQPIRELGAELAHCAGLLGELGGDVLAVGGRLRELFDELLLKLGRTRRLLDGVQART